MSDKFDNEEAHVMSEGNFLLPRNNQKQASLLCLPFEIRYLILQQLLKSPRSLLPQFDFYKAKADRGTQRGCFDLSLQLLCCCQVLHSEGKPILYQENQLSTFVRQMGSYNRFQLLDIEVKFSYSTEKLEFCYRKVSNSAEQRVSFDQVRRTVRKFQNISVTINCGSFVDWDATMLYCIRALLVAKNVTIVAMGTETQTSPPAGLGRPQSQEQQKRQEEEIARIGNRLKSYRPIRPKNLVGCEYLRCRSIAFRNLSNDLSPEEQAQIARYEELITSDEPVHDIRRSCFELIEAFERLPPADRYPFTRDYSYEDDDEGEHKIRALSPLSQDSFCGVHKEKNSSTRARRRYSRP
ncbi:hypothetical protein PMZ80_005879 [Knufia obscura]|uniref:Uncharacterized protein n=2 Tax=Knufia TaxID=430999 RepID=A0AAN8INV7_9EURO|nr:hypothetical protein PMZ80_005879 [Knufia obscura]KAK5954547.1 hypothetical protein OHC33_004269 [Knufia fluminis]